MGGVFCFQAEDGIRDLVRSRGLGDVYKRQVPANASVPSLDGIGGQVNQASAAQVAHASPTHMDLSLIHI